MTAALEGGEWSAARPGRTLPSGKTRYPFYSRLGGPQGRSGREENLVPTGIRSRTVQPVVSRYTDWATRPTPCCQYLFENVPHWTLSFAISIQYPVHKRTSGLSLVHVRLTFQRNFRLTPMPLPVGSKGCVCGPPGGTDIFLLWVMCGIR